MIESSVEERLTQLGTLNQVAASNQSLSFTYLWMQAGDHPTFEKDAGLDFGFPALVVVDMPVQAYAVMYATFNTEEIKRFLTLVSQNKIKLMEPLPKQGLKFESVSKWDGQEASK